MKYFISFALIVAVATAAAIKPTHLTEELQQISEIIAAINSPSTDPATATLLEQMLYETLGLTPAAAEAAIVEGVSPVGVVEGISPIAVGPAIVEGVSPAHAEAAIVDFVHTEETVAPAAVAEVPAPVTAAQSSSPLVQIIVNVNAEATPGVQPVAVIEPETVVAPTPVVERPTPEVSEITPTPVAVVEEAAVIPEAVVLPEAILPEVVEPVQVAEPALPIIVVEASPEPAAVGEPELPIAVQPVILPEELN